MSDRLLCGIASFLDVSEGVQWEEGQQGGACGEWGGAVGVERVGARHRPVQNVYERCIWTSKHVQCMFGRWVPD